MKKLPKLDEGDWGYAKLDPDPDFDAEHNQKVIDNVIRQNRIKFKEKEAERKRQLGERTSAIASYVKSVAKDKSNTTPEGYFGKKYLTHLRGKQIIDIMKHAKKQQEAEEKGWAN